jgi:predicted N-acyltransferase
MQVDFDDYLAALAKERRRGAKRARRLGGAPNTSRASLPASV